MEEDDSPGLRRGLKPELAMHRTSPSAWLALLIKDYKDHTPPDPEVREEALGRLGSYFNKDSLEFEQAADATLAQLRAQRLLFRGEVENQPMSGECLILAHQGFAYWLLAWAPADQAASVPKELDGLSKRFGLTKDRKAWKEKPAQVLAYDAGPLPKGAQQ